AGVIMLAVKIHPIIGGLVNIWLMSTTLATRSLAGAARAVGQPLIRGDLFTAREKLAMIVGRDTAELSEGEIVRGTVETVAENTSDGVVAPLFYLFLGGAPLAMAYKAINTLDSMVGYRNERYLNFGWAGARLDDMANYLPARLTAVLLSLAAVIGPGKPARGLQTLLRDGRRHPSPNSGYPEAAVAGVLGVRLGGYNSYHGRSSFREYIGEDLTPLRAVHIGQAVKLMYIAAVLAAAVGWLASSWAAVLPGI
ncbi:MAG: adenosylcobinamide-phosphate synthase CbiB, partial [Bacillota bacterium]